MYDLDIKWMQSTYSNSYVETIDGTEQIEEQVIMDNRLQRCCTRSSEFVKAIVFLSEESEEF